MVEIIWTESALHDLNDIAGYIALDKARAAQKLVSNVFDRVDLLTDAPASGRKVPELRKSRYREVGVGPCRIFYRVTGDVIVVLHVMRGERLLRKYLLEERENNDN